MTTRRKSAWTARHTPTIGLSTQLTTTTTTTTSSSTYNNTENGGEIFFLNQETGETTWDRPPDYESEEEEALLDDRALAKFELGDELNNVFPKFDPRSGEALNDNVTQREERLEQLRLVIKYCGSKQEWEPLAPTLVQTLLSSSYWGNPQLSARARLSIAQLLVSLCLLDPNAYPNEFLNHPGVLSRNITNGLREGKSSNDAIETFLTILDGVLCSATMNGLCIPMTSESLVTDDENIMVTLFDILVNSEENLFLLTGKIIAGLFFHSSGSMGNDYELISTIKGLDVSELQISSRKSVKNLAATTTTTTTTTTSISINPLVGTLWTKSSSTTYRQLLFEALLKLLNSQQYPFDDDALLSHVLRMFRILLESAYYHNGNGTSDISPLFLSNDLNLLQDITITELRNLPTNAIRHRFSYLCLLYSIIKRDEWNAHAADQVRGVLESIILVKDDGVTPGIIKALAAEVLELAEVPKI
jgi:hypothetical protein